jgi:CRP-like cAMP-binding protein
MFANELARLERRLESKLYVPARSRVAAVVADLFTWFGEGSGAPFTPPVNRRDIAELADVTPETVSRALSELKSCGAIETKGASFRVVDKAALFSLARLCS